MSRTMAILLVFGEISEGPKSVSGYKIRTLTADYFQSVYKPIVFTRDLPPAPIIASAWPLHAICGDSTTGTTTELTITLAVRVPQPLSHR